MGVRPRPLKLLTPETAYQGLMKLALTNGGIEGKLQLLVVELISPVPGTCWSVNVPQNRGRSSTSCTEHMLDLDT